ncbi:MAG: CRISPR-associated protein Csm6 [Lachnospiraceae bacterium]|nr:CRISPR-associated protein Csm6 [Lachnospiraceae bacterium]
MNQTILFSPVGGTDPISLSNYRDGSMLHICRVYQPSKIVLYMSYEVLENQKKDDRYRYCLNRLAKLQKREMQYEIIERDKLKEVQDFDYFYRDFRGIIESICHSMDETDTLLLNVSSGTPAMKSGLLVLQTLGEFPCKLIQVVTPMRKMNEHTHIGYEVETLWELNEDNSENFENRCQEVKCPTLSMIKNEEIIKKHISVYDYQAAVSVAQTMPSEYTVKYLDLLEMAGSRVLLDSKKVDKILEKHNFNCLPVREGNNRKMFEYALGLEIKFCRGEYADFIRGITPLIVDLLEVILKKQCHIDLKNYTYKTAKNVRRWDRRKLKDTKIDQILQQEYEGEFKYNEISSIHLNALIQRISENGKLKMLTQDLREVETRIRNLAAHEIVSITDEVIKEKTGFSSEQIMNKIREIFTYTGIRTGQDAWNSYNIMNQRIIEAMQH